MIDPVQHIPLVRKIVFDMCRYRGMLPGEVDDSEEFADGCMGLMAAAKVFDPSRGFQFSTIASRYIAGYVQSGRNRRKNKGTRPHNGGHPNPRMNFGDITFTDACFVFKIPDEFLARTESHKWIDDEHAREIARKAFAVLDERESLVVRKVIMEGQTLRATGLLVGLSAEGVRLVIRAAIRKVRLALGVTEDGDEC